MIYDPLPCRICSICKQSLPIVEFWIAKRHIGGRSGFCRTCQSERYLGHTPRQPIKAQNGMRFCIGCRTERPLSAFSAKVRGEQTYYNSRCRDCDNLERKKKRNSPRLVRLPGTPTECTKCGNEYPWLREYFCWNNRKGVTQPCKQCVNKRTRAQYARDTETVQARKHAWNHANATKRRIYTEQRIALKRQLPNSLTEPEWLTCLEYWGNCCVYCGNLPGLFPGMNMTTDHYIPVTYSRPGNPGTVADNILPACQSCNASKSNRPADEWLNERYSPRKTNEILARIERYFEWVRRQEK